MKTKGLKVTSPKVKLRPPTDFDRGFICAVACILRLHGERQIAKDVLLNAGNIDWATISEFDLEPIQAAGLIK